MKAVPRWCALAVLAAAALPAFAGLSQYKDWDKSPEYQLLATDAERKDWKKVSSDEEASKFIALFWARRDPDLKTPVNEFKIRFDALVGKADELFTLGRKRGALSERGRLFILVGPPKGISKRADRGLGTATAGALPGEAVTVTYTFVYDQEQLPAWAGVKSLTTDITVDPSTNSDSLVEAGPVRRLEKLAPEAYLVNKDLKEAPVFKTKEQIEAEQKAANEAAAELAKGPALTPPVKEALEGLLARDPSGPMSLMPLAYRDGATRLMAQLFAPASSVPSPKPSANVSASTILAGVPHAAASFSMMFLRASS